MAAAADSLRIHFELNSALQNAVNMLYPRKKNLNEVFMRLFLSMLAAHSLMIKQ